MTPTRGASPHDDAGVAVRRIFHQLRSHASGHFHGQLGAIFAVGAPVPTRGLTATRRFAVGAVVVYHLTVWHRFKAGEDLRVGRKPFLKAA